VKEAQKLGFFQKLARTMRILAGSVLRRPNIDWVTAGEVKRKRKIYNLLGIYETMLPSLLICIVLGLGSFWLVKGFVYVLPILGLWFLAPLIVYATSR